MPYFADKAIKTNKEKRYIYESNSVLERAGMGHFCIVFHDYGAVRWQGKSGVTWCSYSSHAQMNNSLALFVCCRLNAHWVRALLVGRAGAPPISVLNFHEACSSKLDAVHSPQACALIALSLLIANQTIFAIRI